MHNPTGRDTRVNLHVYAQEEGRRVFHIVHVGFFPHKIADAVVERLDARGLAYCSRVQNQTGTVEIVTHRMDTLDPAPTDTTKFIQYEPRRNCDLTGGELDGVPA